MVKNISSSIILGLTFINFIGILSIFISLSNYNSRYYYYRKLEEISEFKNNLRGNYKKIYIKEEKINKKDNINNYTYYNEDEFKMLKINNTNYSQKNLQLRKLRKINHSFYYNAILALNFIYLYFCFNLVSSFLIGDDECPRCCCNCNGDCNCSNSRNGGNGGAELLVCLILIFIVLMIYYSTKFCGKHLSRYISLSFIIIINFLIFILSLFFLFQKETTIKINIFISLILLIFNSLGIILPNLKQCDNLVYKYIPSPSIIEKYPQYQLPPINNNVMMNNNNSNYNNFQNSNNTNYPVPIVNNEYTGYPQMQNNISVISNSTTSSGELSNQRDMSNENFGRAPLPTQELPSENEIYAKSSKN